MDSFYDNGEESMQTRAQDDLFGDDFTPATEPEPVAPTPPPQQQGFERGSRGSAPRSRGRGRGRGGTGATPTFQATSANGSSVSTFNPLGESRHAPNPLGESRHAPKVALEPEPETAPPVGIEQPPDETATVDPPADAPTEPRHTKPTAVRGDRSATGGTARTKLTEEELAARISSIQLKNATLEAAHARAQADADSFAQRENEASKRRQEERRDRQQMMGEREKNRQRKLKAQEGREWDLDKREEDFADQRRGYGRGAHGGVTGTRLGGGERAVGFDGAQDDGREHIYREDRGRGRGRGGRGARGDARAQGHGPQQPPQAEEFPALASGPAKQADQGADEVVAAPKLSFPAQDKAQPDQSDAKDKDQSTNADISLDHLKKQSWADMVEDSKAR
ncbi:hypothetical protein KVT40_007061 [Elsinoe batatas]|uniref:Uncharacterized protein n=1 Tax=Elsinoe batatas TaxID=2601811 RepID=A0A8K0KXZ2_9PEZI|nr:hypothetical protein KVT40_007061 [Elsinoe batatas]